MVKALFDTNILIDYLNAVPQARVELRRFAERAISIVSWMEVMAGAPPEVADATRAFLGGFDISTIDFNIAERAAALKRDKRVKLPDAIIWATAQTNQLLLVTRNTKDFPADDPGIRHPYVLPPP